ncbi:hypothetical protein NUW58_g4323 [Xylaria curta]|uniref:Uncharacterized protein n=1 Tax=Xylaria curta TaxID=42375 RepID=A0ACC1P819_9PEZI|nr:hypothetical protein NUW58_g4323 [Xylaria curta]
MNPAWPYGLGLVNMVVFGLVAGIVTIIARGLYNAFLHPLRKYPGPFLHRMTTLPRAIHLIRGRLPFEVKSLHDRYGPVVRIAPDELAFSSPQAWRDIYGHKAGQEEFPKYAGVYRAFKHMPVSIVTSDATEHGLLRRLLAVGFSDRAMREQEPIICSYVNLLVSRLKDAAQTLWLLLISSKRGGCQDMTEWYTRTTFDIIGDLTFGAEGFGCLKNARSHPWVRLITTAIRQQAVVLALISLGLRGPIAWVHKTLGVFADNDHNRIVKEKVAQRIKDGERSDLLDGLIRNKELSLEKLTSNAAVLIPAGSETTATLLSGVTYFLTTHVDMLRRLENEVRSAFQSDEEITFASVTNLSFMLACLNETMRFYPPLVTGLPRQTHKDAIISGEFVPRGVSSPPFLSTLTVFPAWRNWEKYAINHDERYWKNPEEFAPTRWMGDPEYKNDQLDAMQPFSAGPRNCIGRNLAYAEARLVLAKIVYNFDMTLADDSRGWLNDQKAFTVWDKPPLNIHLSPTKP